MKEIILSDFEKKMPLGVYGLLAVLVVGCLVWGGMVYRGAEDDDPALVREEAVKVEAIAKDCDITAFKVAGASLEPAYKSGAVLEFFTGDQCPYLTFVDYGDLALLKTARAEKLVVKFVRGFSGDKIALAPRNDVGGMVLQINDADVQNSVGALYIIPPARQALLRLYIRDYKGVIPQDSFLLLGDDVQGTLDSTRFGLVHVDDIRGVMRLNDDAGDLPRH